MSGSPPKTSETPKAPALRPLPAGEHPAPVPVESSSVELVSLGHAKTKTFAFWAVLILIILAGGLLAAWLFLPPRVAVVHPTRGPAVQAVYATGTVEATVMMPIAGRVTARLAELDVDEGAEVKQGQILARLEDQDLQSSLKQLRAQEQFAKQEYDRDAALVKSGAISKVVFQRAKSDWEAAQAATARAAAEADFLKLTAPADGKIIRRDGEIGQLIPANQAVFWLSQHQPLRISSEVDEEDVAQVKVGQEVLIRADAFYGKVFHGRVQAITPKGDPIARSYRVRIELKEDTPLFIGMTAETNIIIHEDKNALLLPASAVQKGKVWLVKDGRLSEQFVTLGAKGPEEVEILSGISADDAVVLNPDASLKPGSAVRASLSQAK